MGSLSSLQPRRRVSVQGDRAGSAAGLSVHRQGEPGRRHQQWHRGARLGQHRRPRRQAGDGRQGSALQAVRRHRRLRSRNRHHRPRGADPHRQAPRADFRRHQPGGHPRSRLLRDRAPSQGRDEHPGLPRRPARHRHHLRRGAAQRPRADRQALQRRAYRLLRRRRGGALLRQALHEAGGAAGEHRRLRQPRRDLCRADRADGPLQAGLRGGDRAAHPGRGSGRGGRLHRSLGGRRGDGRHGALHGARSHRLRHGEPRPGDRLRGGPRGAPGRHRRDRPQRLSQSGQQRPGLPVHLSRRPGRARHRHQRRHGAGGGARPRRARPRGRAGQCPQRLRPRLPGLRPRVLDPQADRPPRAAAGAAGGGQGRHGQRRGAGADRGLRRLPATTGDLDLTPFRADARHHRPRQARAEAGGLPRGRARQDPACRQDPGRRGDRAPDPARPPRRHRRPPARPRPAGVARDHHPCRNLRPFRELCAEAPRAAPPRRHDPGGGAQVAAPAQLFRQHDGGGGRRRRPDLRAHPVLPRDHPPGAPDHRHPARRAARLRRLHPDRQRPHLLPRRHHGEHRPDAGGAGRDRAAHRRARPPLRRDAAGGHALVLQLWLQQTPGGDQGAPRHRDRPPSRSQPGGGRRDAGRHRGLRVDPPRDLPVEPPQGAGERAHLPRVAVGEHRLQADLAPGERRGGGADPARHGKAGACPPERSRSERHCEHDSPLCRGRPGARRRRPADFRVEFETSGTADRLTDWMALDNMGSTEGPQRRRSSS